MLIANQLMQVFGTRVDPREQLFHDWSAEPFTCSRLDADSAGHLEGALDAMRRVQQQIVAAATAVTAAISVVRAPPRARLSPSNDQSLAVFSGWVAEQQQPTFEDYRQRINHSLAIQQHEQLTQRAMLAAIEQVLNAALRTLEALPFDTTDVPIERGRCALIPQVQSAFQGLLQRFLDQVLAFNAASCALSNFPHEHRPSKDYEQTILRDIAAAWQEFSLAANSLLLGRRDPPRQPVSSEYPIGLAS